MDEIEQGRQTLDSNLFGNFLGYRNMYFNQNNGLKGS